MEKRNKVRFVASSYRQIKLTQIDCNRVGSAITAFRQLKRKTVLSAAPDQVRRITKFLISVMSSMANRMPSRPSPEFFTPP